MVEAILSVSIGCVTARSTKLQRGLDSYQVRHVSEVLCTGVCLGVWLAWRVLTELESVPSILENVIYISIFF